MNIDNKTINILRQLLPEAVGFIKSYWSTIPHKKFSPVFFNRQRLRGGKQFAGVGAAVKTGGLERGAGWFWEPQGESETRDTALVPSH